ncbi:LSU ribosomal protein L25P [Ornithinibacillus halophilus]|uniref:Large ribosomal subunit protein bL25 n=2 Tax=Ornithinibacillus halophilus TaxID=930117 RepID=A0A1M5JKP0_9BACI|nr:LSU ribosomal protein L25P [Ornithinibacillus halophilus]
MSVTLKAIKREDHARSTTRNLRESGQVPAVVYGKDKETKSIAVNSIELVKTVRDEGRNAIISLDIDSGNSVDVMLHDYQMDDIKDELLHADFYIVNMGEAMDVDVSIRLDGDAPGVKDGGIMQQALYEAKLRVKPNAIPEEIVLDVSNMTMGDIIIVADLPKSSEYEILEDDDTTVATILAPRTDDDVEGIENENAEPELVGEVQKDKNEE